MEFDNLFNGMTVVDGHLHMHNFESKDGVLFIDGFERYRNKYGFKGLNIASLPSGMRDVSNNIMCAFYKLAHEGTFAHAGLIYNKNPRDCEGMDPLTQYNELMEIGFDGIKMLEGKPNLYKIINIPLCDDFYYDFFKACERDNTHILMHAVDPEEFWEEDKVDEETKQKGWFYGDGTHVSREEIYSQVDALLEKHPRLTLTLAHFFFCSKRPEKLVEMFEKHENLAVDITPGGEMFVSFNEDYEYFRAFFERYSKRILFGTDGDSLPEWARAMDWLAERLYKYIATDEATDSWSDHPLKGLNLPFENAQCIMGDNFLRRVGKEPRKINKEALKAYIEKYKHLILDPKMLDNIEKMAKELL